MPLLFLFVCLFFLFCLFLFFFFNDTATTEIYTLSLTTLFRSTDTIKGKINEAEEMARKIWLAGLGAYGKSVEEAQGRYEKLSEEANKMFDELVTKGEKLDRRAHSELQSHSDLVCRLLLEKKKKTQNKKKKNTSHTKKKKKTTSKEY